MALKNPVQSAPENPPPKVKLAGKNLTTQLHLITRLKTGEANTYIPLYTFMNCTPLCQ
jgi:hypothetical protein